MLNRFDLIELIAVVSCLIFAIAISLYHISYNGYLGLNVSQWQSVWAISENGLLLVMSFLISYYSIGIVKMLFRWLFIPYFIIKLVYHFSCFSGAYVLPAKIWEDIWSFALVGIIVTGLTYCLILIPRKNA